MFFGQTLSFRRSPFNLEPLCLGHLSCRDFTLPSFGLALRIRLAQGGQFAFDQSGATLCIQPRGLLSLRIRGLTRNHLALAGVGFALHVGGTQRGQFALRLRRSPIGFLELGVGIVARRDFAFAGFGFTLCLGFAKLRKFALRVCRPPIGIFTLRLSLTASSLFALRFYHEALCDFAERATLGLLALSLHLARGRQLLLRGGSALLGFLALGLRCP